MPELKLGSKVKDTVTGFEGTLTGKAEYLHNVPAGLVETLKDGETKREWLELSRLVLVAA